MSLAGAYNRSEVAVKQGYLASEAAYCNPGKRLTLMLFLFSLARQQDAACHAEALVVFVADGHTDADVT